MTWEIPCPCSDRGQKERGRKKRQSAVRSMTFKVLSSFCGSKSLLLTFWNKPLNLVAYLSYQSQEGTESLIGPSLFSWNQPHSLQSHCLLEVLYLPSGQPGQTSTLPGIQNPAKINLALEMWKTAFFLTKMQMASMTPQPPPPQKDPILKTVRFFLI